MKWNGKMERNMEKELLNMQMVMCMKEYGSTVIKKAMEYIIGLMEIYMNEDGKIEKWQMVINMMENGKMEKGFAHTGMIQPMMENGKMEKRMEEGYLKTQMVRTLMVNGMMEMRLEER